MTPTERTEAGCIQPLSAISLLFKELMDRGGCGCNCGDNLCDHSDFQSDAMESLLQENHLLSARLRRQPWSAAFSLVFYQKFVENANSARFYERGGRCCRFRTRRGAWRGTLAAVRQLAGRRGCRGKRGCGPLLLTDKARRRRSRSASLGSACPMTGCRSRR